MNTVTLVKGNTETVVLETEKEEMLKNGWSELAVVEEEPENKKPIKK